MTNYEACQRKRARPRMILRGSERKGYNASQLKALSMAKITQNEG